MGVPPARRGRVGAGGSDSALQQPQPQLRLLELAAPALSVPTGLGDADDVVGQPLPLRLGEPLLHMGAS